MWIFKSLYALYCPIGLLDAILSNMISFRSYMVTDGIQDHKQGFSFRPQS